MENALALEVAIPAKRQGNPDNVKNKPWDHLCLAQTPKRHGRPRPVRMFLRKETEVEPGNPANTFHSKICRQDVHS